MNEAIAGDITLTVDGTRWAGWTEAEVTRTIEAMCGGFRLTLSERWDGRARPIADGARCSLSLAGQTVVTGWLDDIEDDEDAQSHDIQVSGRDAAGDLIDCSAAGTPGEWRNIGLGDLVAAIAGPFGVAVRAQVDLGAPIAVFRIEEGESGWRAIERACRYRQVLCISDGRGGLDLVRAGSARADVRLVRGQNILRARMRRSQTDRYSEYVVKGQRAAAIDEDPSLAAHGIARASDPDIRRYRPLVIVADDQADAAGLERRAQWEASVRRGRGLTLSVTVQGWRQTPGGRLWQPNELVHVSWRQVQQEMLVCTVRHRFGGAGSTTDLDLQPPEAYAAEPLGESEEDQR